MHIFEYFGGSGFVEAEGIVEDNIHVKKYPFFHFTSRGEN